MRKRFNGSLSPWTEKGPEKEIPIRPFAGSLIRLFERTGEGPGRGIKRKEKIMNRTYRRIVGSVLPVLAFSLLGVVGAIAAEDAALRGEVVRF
jgi:hypothetical protein